MTGRAARWRTEDAAYAAATAAALGVVLFLVAGNFGLLPSPISSSPRSVSSIEVPALAAAAPEPPTILAPGTPPTQNLPLGPGSTPTPPDIAAPQVTIDASDGEIRDPTESATLTGDVSDDRRVDKVVVTFSSDTASSVAEADLVCDAAVRVCGWSAAAPANVGTYTVQATAIDAAGNTDSAGPIQITYALPGADGGLVGNLLDTLGGLL